MRTLWTSAVLIQFDSFGIGRHRRRHASGGSPGSVLRKVAQPDAVAAQPDVGVDRPDAGMDRSSNSDLGAGASLELVSWMQSVGGTPIRVLKRDQHIFLGDWENRPQIAPSGSVEDGSIQTYDVTDPLLCRTQRSRFWLAVSIFRPRPGPSSPKGAESESNQAFEHRGSRALGRALAWIGSTMTI